MCVVRDLEPVYLGTRKNEEIGQRNGHAGGPATIGDVNRSTPDLSRDLVVGNKRLIASKRLALGMRCQQNQTRLGRHVCSTRM